MFLKIDTLIKIGSRMVSFLGLVVLGMSPKGEACPVEGCAPFQTTGSFPIAVQDTVDKFLGLPAKSPMQVNLFPRDTGMTWEYHFHYDVNRYLGGQGTFLFRMTLLESSDSGSIWKSRWRLGYHGKTVFYSTTHIPFERPWTEYDTVMRCHRDSGLAWDQLLPFFPKSINSFSRPFIRPMASDSFAIGACCARPVSNGQSNAPLYVSIDKKWGNPGEVHLYQQNRGLLFSWFSVIEPESAYRASASLTYYGREPDPVPVQHAFRPEGHIQKSNRPESFRANGYQPFNVLGRARPQGRQSLNKVDPWVVLP
jgi:hypothetical protein